MISFTVGDNERALNYRNAEYSDEIKDCMASALTQFIATYDITDKIAIQKLSSFCDLVSFAIESQIIAAVCKTTQSIPDDFSIDVFEGEDIRYLHYQEPIKVAVMHSIRLFLLINKDSASDMLNDIGITLDQIEELADNVAYYIKLSTMNNINKKVAV